MGEKRMSFSGSIGFVLAAAGSAVGLGNLWRFPYLAAKDGGGLFLVVYLILAVTFGFTMMVSEIAIGRKTKQSALTAYGRLHQKSGWIGAVATVVPFLIMPYYCVIGGWVLKYAVTFVTGQAEAACQPEYFNQFISAPVEPLVLTVIFLAFVAAVIFLGVNKGIETISKVLMPILLVCVVGIAVFSMTVQGDKHSGWEGMKVYLVPDLSGMGFQDVFRILLDAMGQLFYSISVAMGIMVTYGSYFRDENNLVKSVNRIEIFDTIVAFLAGVMIVPSVYAFLGEEGLQQAGPGLMFQALPKVFVAMGPVGNFVGAAFFIMVFFAALTSAISIMEVVVASVMDRFGWKRVKSSVFETLAALVIGVVICMGYNVLPFSLPLPNGTNAQLLDLFDYVSNNILMPVVALGTCILIGWIVKPGTVIDEATKNGETFQRRRVYVVMVKFIAPLMLLLLLMVSLGIIR